MSRSLQRIPTNSHTWLLGDINLPKYDWVKQEYKPNCKFINTYNNFFDIMNYHNLEQVVHISTRQENTLILFYINQPSLVQNTKTLPALGTSDHDIVFHEMNITIGRKHKTPRTINQYKKADWDKIRTELKTFQEHYFCKQTIHTTTEEKWLLIKTKIQEIIDKHVPSKTLRQKQDIPWLTPEIKRLIRKRDRIYKKLKSTRVEEKPNIIEKHRSAKHLVQQKLRQTDWNYIENIIIEDSKVAESKPSKKLWSFIKKQKSENIGVSPLKVSGITKRNPIDQAEALNNSAFTTQTIKTITHLQHPNH